jgi:hypothetical protein
MTNTLKALLRRVAVAALTTLIASWAGWIEAAVKGDETTAAWWPTLWLLLEAVQKYLRERKAA